MPNDNEHLKWMAAALEEAAAAAARGEAPVGAIAVKDGAELARAGDQRQARGDPTAHAEILALAQAGRRSGDWRLDGCDLYVTLEPCPMCAGAIVMARVRRLIYGAPNHKAGAVATHCRLLDIETFNHKVEVIAGVEAEAAAQLLKEFFGRLRAPDSRDS